MDISKYDKSQDEFHCAVEYEIWRRLGLEDFLAEVWKQGHRKTTLKDVINNGYDETKNANVPKQKQSKEQEEE